MKINIWLAISCAYSNQLNSSFFFLCVTFHKFSHGLILELTLNLNLILYAIYMFTVVGTIEELLYIYIIHSVGFLVFCVNFHQFRHYSEVFLFAVRNHNLFFIFYFFAFGKSMFKFWLLFNILNELIESRNCQSDFSCVNCS